MANPTIHVPQAEQHRISCPSCHNSVAYTIVPNTHPHLYCTLCNHAYHQLHAEHGRVRLQRVAHRVMHTIQSHAPVCECGGLFLFNAKPRCPHCHKHLSLTQPEDSKGRLRFGDLVLFDGSKLFLDNGIYHLYQFGA